MEHTHEFEYLREVAQKYGLLYGVDELDAAADNMTPERLQELRDVYAIICSGDNRSRIERWIGDSLERRGKISKREFDFAMGVGQVFVLFDYLVRRGIQPFCDEETEYSHPCTKLNRDKLPKELVYLIEPAEIYGIHQSESEIFQFLDRAHRSDMDVLARTAERIRVNRQLTAITEWRLKDENLPEAELVGWLIMMLLPAGLRYE